MRRELLKVGFAPDTTAVLYYFTDSNTAEQPRGRLPESTHAFVDAPGAPLLFTPARLTLPDKGVDYLLSALAKLSSPFRAVVAHTGSVETLGSTLDLWKPWDLHCICGTLGGANGTADQREVAVVQRPPGTEKGARWPLD